jgi:hypothetical protein
MADSPLRECWHKLSRGEEHLNTFNAERQGFLGGDPYSVASEYDAKQSKYLFRLNILQTLPQARWATIIGDCVHNVRSALDYIAWRLAGSDLTDTKTMFPIYNAPEKFHDVEWRLRRIHEGARAEIRKLQPYGRSDPVSRLLWALQELDARDKHKLLAMTAAMPQGASISVNVVHGSIPVLQFDVDFPEPRCEQDAILAEVILASDSGNPQVKVEGKFTFDIAFERGIIETTGDCFVSDALRQILQTVNDVTRRFEQLIVDNPNWLPG